MIKTNIIICCLLIGLMFSCTEPYNRQIDSYAEALVVEGMITTEPGPYTVKLMNTIPLSADTMIYERNAVVTISDNEGNFETLTEVSPGVYKSSPGGIQGKIGNSYTLTINTAEGDKYESNPVKLQKGPEIDSLSTSIGHSVSFENIGDSVKGININVTTKEWNTEEDYYLRWEYEETWKVRPNYFPIDTVYKNTKPCWMITYNTDIIIENTATFTANKLENKPIIFLSHLSPKPYKGYSVLVKQYTINESVFEFYKMLRENNEDNGDIFDNVPYNAVSNIECCNDSEKKVFGYFDAADVDQTRKYYKQPIEGIWFTDAINEDCTPLFLETSLFDSLSRDWSYPVYVVDRSAGMGEAPPQVSFFKRKRCVDCSVYATTTKKPSFWDYD